MSSDSDASSSSSSSSEDDEVEPPSLQKCDAAAAGAAHATLSAVFSRQSLCDVLAKASLAHPAKKNSPIATALLTIASSIGAAEWQELYRFRFMFALALQWSPLQLKRFRREVGNVLKHLEAAGKLAADETADAVDREIEAEEAEVLRAAPQFANGTSRTTPHIVGAWQHVKLQNFQGCAGDLVVKLQGGGTPV